MNAAVTRFDPKWLRFTFARRWAAAAAAKVSLSTRPPEPVVPCKKPLRVELVGGTRYSWCTCGHSRKQETMNQAASARRLCCCCSSLKLLNEGKSFTVVDADV